MKKDGSPPDDFVRGSVCVELFGSWCDVASWSSLRATCSSGSIVAWPESAVLRVSARGNERLFERVSYNLQRSRSRRRALLVISGLAQSHREEVIEHVFPSLLPLFEGNALGDEEDRLCSYVVRSCVAEETAESLVDSGFLYRAATILDRVDDNFVGMLSTLTGRARYCESARLCRRLLERGKKCKEATFALEKLVALASSLNSAKWQLPKATFDALGSPSALGALAAVARRAPGSRHAQSALFIVSALADFGAPLLQSRQASRRVEVVSASANNLYATESPSAFADRWHSCPALALEVLCKLAHLGLDEFGVYDDEEVALMLAPAAKIIVECALAQNTTTSLYAVNALRFLAGNGHSRAILESDPDCERKIEELASNAARASNHRKDDGDRLRTLAYRSRALLQAISL